MRAGSGCPPAPASAVWRSLTPCALSLEWENFRRTAVQRPCLIVHFLEQLLEDVLHIVRPQILANTRPEMGKRHSGRPDVTALASLKRSLAR